MPLTPERRMTADELVNEINQRRMDEYYQKKATWDKMTHEQRVAYIKAVFDRFIQKAQANPQEALQDFMQWFIAPEGALVWAYIWKPEYRQLAIDITSKAYQLIVKYLGPGVRK